MYDVEFSETAARELYKLEGKIQKRIVASLERLRIRPFHFVKRLFNSPYYRLRVGDYRILLDIRENRLLIFVIELGHRKNIYKES